MSGKETSRKNQKKSKNDKRGKDNKEKKLNKEKEGEKEPQVITPVVLSPFDELASVWSLDDNKRQRKLIGELFEIEDGAGLCRESILLDMAYLDLLFAHQSGFNIEQTKVFWNMMRTMQNSLEDPSVTQQSAIKYFKEALLENSVYHQYFNPDARPGSTAASRLSVVPRDMRSPSNMEVGSRSSSKASGLSRSQTPMEDLDDRKKSSSKRSKSRKSEKKGAAKMIATPAEQDEDSQDTKGEPKPSQLFTTENIKQLTEYVTTGFLTHFRLYRCVINQGVFQPRKALETHYFRLETIIPDSFSLEDAIETTQERLQEQTESELPETKTSQRQLDSVGRLSELQERSVSAQDSMSAGSAGLGIEAFPLQPEANNADPVAVLVDMHTTHARAEMDELLKTQAAMLEAKISAMMEPPPSSRRTQRRH